jgi:hypothetical protein
MCQDEGVRAALRISGEPCASDQVAAQQPATVAAAPATVLLAPAVAAPVAPAAAPVAVHKARPEWCYTASTAELRQHSECDVRS